jgi:DNA mismatch repair protein PMS2
LRLFIVDQHASDEKFRFEGFNRGSRIDRQPLVTPQRLSFTPAQEETATAHLDVFRANGFEISRDDACPPGKRLRLSTVPCIDTSNKADRGFVFGEKDVHDLLFTLDEAEVEPSSFDATRTNSGSGLLDLASHRASLSTKSIPRPKRVWQLLASRACRGACMIGKALRVGEMERILVNLGTLDQPWNCPHGRPTMRHLVDADLAWRRPPRKAPLERLLKNATDHAAA